MVYVGGGSGSAVREAKGRFMVKCVMRGARLSSWARILLGAEEGLGKDGRARSRSQKVEGLKVMVLLGERDTNIVRY